MAVHILTMGKQPWTPSYVQAVPGPGGTWQFRARYRVPGGQRVGSRRATTDEALADLTVMREREATAPPELLTLEETMALVLDELKAKGRSPYTLKLHRQCFRQLWKWFDCKRLLHSFTSAEVEAFFYKRRAKGAAVRTALVEIDAMAACFRLAVRRGLLEEDPVKGVDLPKKTRAKPPDWFAPQELGALLQKIRGSGHHQAERDSAVIEFLALTGLRLGEFDGLRVCDVSLPKKQLAVRERPGAKTGAREVRLSTAALAVVRLLLSKRTGTRERLLPIKRAGIEGMLVRWAKALEDRRLHPHALRHTFGTSLALAGATPHQIKAAMGHATLEMGLVYVHLTHRDTEGIVEKLSYHAPRPSRKRAGKAAKKAEGQT